MNFLKKRNLLFLLLINISGIIVADDEIIKIIPIKAIKANTGSAAAPEVGLAASCGAILAEDELVPLTRIPPRYPRDALLRGTEGYVSMELCVDEVGSVISIKIIESKPDKIFNKAALDSLLQWKFEVRTSSGLPVKQKGTTRIDFQI